MRVWNWISAIKYLMTTFITPKTPSIIYVHTLIKWSEAMWFIFTALHCIASHRAHRTYDFVVGEFFCSWFCPCQTHTKTHTYTACMLHFSKLCINNVNWNSLFSFSLSLSLSASFGACFVQFFERHFPVIYKSIVVICVQVVAVYSLKFLGFQQIEATLHTNGILFGIMITWTLTSMAFGCGRLIRLSIFFPFQISGIETFILKSISGGNRRATELKIALRKSMTKLFNRILIWNRHTHNFSFQNQPISNYLWPRILENVEENKKKLWSIPCSKTRHFLIKYLRFDPVEFFNILMYSSESNEKFGRRSEEKRDTYTHNLKSKLMMELLPSRFKKLLASKHKMLCFSFIILLSF